MATAFRHILVTGGAGFVGSTLGLRLKKEFGRAAVTALDNLMRRGSELNPPRLQEAGVRFVRGDIRNVDDIRGVGAFDLLIDCSAEPSVHAGTQGSPRELIDINLGGTINCLEAAREHGAAVLFLSTSRVYPIDALNQLSFREGSSRFELTATQSVPGASDRGISEAFPLAGARSFYGATKLCCEMLLEEYVHTCGLRGIVNRCGLMSGPWQMGKVDQGVVALWVARHHFGLPLKYIGYGGSGKQVRDVLHVDDLADLVLLQLGGVDSWKGACYNVGGGLANAVSLAELTDLCRAQTGREVEIGRNPETSPVDVRIYISDNARVCAAFPWKPRRTVKQVVSDIHAWIAAHEMELQPMFA